MHPGFQTLERWGWKFNPPATSMKAASRDHPSSSSIVHAVLASAERDHGKPSELIDPVLIPQRHAANAQCYHLKWIIGIGSQRLDRTDQAGGGEFLAENAWHPMGVR
jgi:hypothetical protein